jgi:hypothetical protein
MTAEARFASRYSRDAEFAADPWMELAGLEPATSWVRSIRFSRREQTDLQRFYHERLKCRNSFRNILGRVLH